MALCRAVLRATRTAVRGALPQQVRFRRGRKYDDEVPFASVNKFEWGGDGGRVEEHVLEAGDKVTNEDLKEIIQDVMPQAEVAKTQGGSHAPAAAEDGSADYEEILPATDSVLKLADLSADKLIDEATSASMVQDFPELATLPGVTQVLGRYREKSETEKRLMEGVVSDAVVARRPEGAGAKNEGEEAALQELLSPHFSPEVRKKQVELLTSQLTGSAMHTLPEALESKQAAKLHEMMPWEFEGDEPPLPAEYWTMSHAERRFLGLPYKTEDGRWNPPLATFTERAADDINLQLFGDVMAKVRSHGGSKGALLREEVALLREAEEKIFNHLRARLEDMVPYLDERSKIWRRRRGLE
eukprot:TRINITY_DN16522_c0_g2_i1.p1 TRINITY_DN16522_c0_g2~~TRINITY_DN16522_c0_g2_i1.p1  ORF type:complete len:356 (+),score=147.80 TRINITY_DN16522_c0_g2_i1:102-1169(+)